MKGKLHMWQKAGCGAGVIHPVVCGFYGSRRAAQQTCLKTTGLRFPKTWLA